MFGILANLAEISILLFGLVMLVLLLVAHEMGFRSGRFVIQQKWVESEQTMGSGIIAGGMMTLMAFVLGFSLSIAFAGFQQRQNTVVEEAKAIESAWLIAGVQTDDSAGDSIRQHLTDYAGVRLSSAVHGKSPEERKQIADQTLALQRAIWERVDLLEEQSPSQTSWLLISHIAVAFEGAVHQRHSFDMRIPDQIGGVVALTAIFVLFAIGVHFGLHGNRIAVLTGILIVTISVVVSAISDLSRPYHGGINVSPAALQLMHDTLKSSQ